MRACVHTQCVHACVHIHPALNAIRCFAGRENRAADCTRIFIRRISRLAERLFAPTSLSPLTTTHAAFYGLHIRNPGIMQVYYSLRRRNPTAASADAFLGLGIHWRIWCSQYDMPNSRFLRL